MNEYIFENHYKKISVSKSVGPICLPPKIKSHPKEGTVCFTAGWGRNMNGGFIQSWLNEVDLKVFDDSTCKKTQSKKGFISGSMFCAGYLNGEFDIQTSDTTGCLSCIDYATKSVQFTLNIIGIYTALEKL